MDPVSLTSLINAFCEERNWGQFHSVRNLILAIVGEVGELAEIVQWISDEKVGAILEDSQTRERLSEEIADVFIYLLRLASVAQIDIEAAVTSKLEINESRYPAQLAFGSTKKYTEFQ